MAALLIDHHCADFGAWLPHFEAHGATRAAAGVTASIVWQAADDQNHVFVLIKHPDIEALRAFTQSEDIKQRMQAAGVTGAPNFHYLEGGRKFEN